MIHFTQYSDKWTKISVDIGICLGNNQGNFQLYRFVRRENTAKNFRGLLFLTHTVDKVRRDGSGHLVSTALVSWH